MASNERVSTLIELFASDLQSDDIFLVTDMSQRESKKLEMGQLLLFIESSGSFESVTSINADTASYILSQNIHGVIPLAVASTSSISSSWSNTSMTSLFSETSSFANFALSALNINSMSTSFLEYTSSIPNGTSSYSINSLNSTNAVTAFNLFYNGQPNGTASYSVNSVSSNSASFASSSISSSYSKNSTNSVTSSFSISSSFSNTSSYSLNNFNPTKAWSFVTWSVGVTFPLICLNYNISSMTWLSRVVPTGSLSNYDQFGVQFIQPLLNTSYTLLGTGEKAFLSSNNSAKLFIHPLYGNKTTSSFTMSIITSAANDFYTAVSASYPNDAISSVNFQILGL